jgi:hypothetical protein
VQGEPGSGLRCGPRWFWFQRLWSQRIIVVMYLVHGVDRDRVLPDLVPGHREPPLVPSFPFCDFPFYDVPSYDFPFNDG